MESAIDTETSASCIALYTDFDSGLN